MFDSHSNDRRRHPRAPIARSLEIHTAGGKVSCELKDISRSGIAFHSEQAFHEESLFGLDFRAEPHEDCPGLHLEATAAVVRCKPSRDGGFDVAMYFLHVEPESLEDIDAYVAAQLTRSE
ncbi:MAG: PilZ domain-containing protein [Planctomycetota bacterium]